MATFSLILAAVVLSWAWPAAAQAPACDGQAAGTVACVAGRLCACGFGRGGPATGLPDGFRWDCGVLRPRCGEPVPATIDPYRGPLPDALAIERETTNITTVTGDRDRTRAGGDGGGHGHGR